MSEIDNRLQAYFDSMAGGFPKTDGGAEIRILKML